MGQQAKEEKVTEARILAAIDTAYTEFRALSFGQLCTHVAELLGVDTESREQAADWGYIGAVVEAQLYTEDSPDWAYRSYSSVHSNQHVWSRQRRSA